MAKTNWQDPKTGEIRSTHISGLQEAIGKIEEAIGIGTVAETGISLVELFIDNNNRYRMFQAPESKRNWLLSPSPIIKKNGVVITSGFEIDYGGGAVIFTTPLLETDTVSADVTYTTDKTVDLYSNPIVTYNDVISLPKETTNGQISGVELKGLTATNLVKNGDFRNGIDDWFFSHGSIYGVDGDGSVYIKRNTSSYTYIIIRKQYDNFIIGHKYYAKTIFKANEYITNVYIGFGSISANQISSIASFNINTWNILSGMETYTEDFDNYFTVYFKGEDSNAQLNVKEIMFIDLTATFGEGNEPYVEECDKIFANYFEGTNSTICAIRQKSVGKNLFDGKLEQGDIGNSSGVSNPNSNRTRTVNFISVKPSTPYKITSTPTFSLELRYYDINKNFISSAYPAHMNSFTTPSNAKYVRFVNATSYNLDTQIIMNEGSIALPYEPYTESTQYIIAKKDNKIVNLRSLPNGTKDEIRATSSGGYEYVKRVNNIDLANVTMTLNTVNANVDRIFITSPLIASQSYTVEGFPFKTYEDSINNAYTSYLSASGSEYQVRLVVPKGTYTSSADAQSKLAGTKLTYQLAGPEEIPIQVSGTLQSFEGGTVYVDPYLRETYNIKNTTIALDYPIVSIDKLVKIDGITETEVAGTLSADGKTVTVSGAGIYRVEGEIRPEESTQGQKTIQVPTNMKAQVNSNTDGIRQASVMLSEHDNMLLGLALEVIDLDVELVNHKSKNCIDAHGKIPSCQVTREDGMSISNLITTDVLFTSIGFDNDNMFNISNSKKITINTDGIYLIVFETKFEHDPNGERHIELRVNDITPGFIQEIRDATQNSPTRFSVSAVKKLNVGDYISVWVTQTAGGFDPSGKSLNITNSILSIVKVG